MEIRNIKLTRSQSLALAIAILVLCVIGFILNFNKIKNRETGVQGIINAQDDKTAKEVSEEDYY